MRAVFESIFSVSYLVIIAVMGYNMLSKSGTDSNRKWFGVMALVLSGGDAFHLIPRVFALLTNSLEAHVFSLGIGKMITSITMTYFYAFLYLAWRNRYNVVGKDWLTYTISGLAGIRILLCLLPVNAWTSINPPILWAIIRNIPFLILGALVVVIFIRRIKENNDKCFRFMPLAIILSFLLYIPVVLFAGKYPMVGMLMIPKTLAYVWIIVMGYKLKNPIDPI